MFYSYIGVTHFSSTKNVRYIRSHYYKFRSTLIVLITCHSLLTLFFSCSRVLSNFFVFPLACFKSSRHFTSCFSKSANFSFVSSTSLVNFSKSLYKRDINKRTWKSLKFNKNSHLKSTFPLNEKNPHQSENTKIHT